MSLIQPEEVEALIAHGVEPEALQGIIDREEAWLARKIGPLVGEREVTLYRRPGDLWYSGPLYLRRSAPSVVVVDGGTAVEVDYYASDSSFYRASNNLRYESLPWTYPVVVTYTPDDEQEVKAAILDLVRLELVDSPYNQEAADGHSTSKPLTVQLLKDSIAKRLLPAPRATTLSFR